MEEELTEFSVTEVTSFRYCRRQWYWSARRLLQPKDPSPYSWLGQGVHSGLAGYYLANRDAALMLEAYDSWYERQAEELSSKYEATWDTTGALLEAQYRVGRAMLENYAQYDRDNPLEGDVIAVEGGWQSDRRIAVPLLDLERLPVYSPSGKIVTLSGRIDLVLRGKHGRPVIVDHKTKERIPSYGALDMDDQLTGYAYLWWRLTGELPEMIMYNVLIRRLPVKPRLLKNGELSRDYTQLVSYSSYLEAIKEHGLNEADYADFLAYLKQDSWSKFFSRISTVRNLHEIMAYERRLYHLYQDMVSALEREERRYPNPTSRACEYCAFRMPCKACEDGGDPQALLDALYEVGEPRY